MRRKSKRQKEEEEEEDFQTIYQAMNDVFPRMFMEDKMFAVLVACGFPSALAFRLANPSSTASGSSSAVLASRKLAEPKVQQFIQMIMDCYWNGLLVLNTQCLKHPRRRCEWESPKEKRLIPRR